MPEITAVGHELLSLFDIEYHEFSKDITEVLLQNPDKRFCLSLERSPLKKGEKKIEET